MCLDSCSRQDFLSPLKTLWSVIHTAVRRIFKSRSLIMSFPSLLLKLFPRLSLVTRIKPKCLPILFKRLSWSGPYLPLQLHFTTLFFSLILTPQPHWSLGSLNTPRLRWSQCHGTFYSCCLKALSLEFGVSASKSFKLSAQMSFLTRYFLIILAKNSSPFCHLPTIVSS